MKMTFKTVVAKDGSGFAWDGYEEGPEIIDTPVLVKEQDVDEYLVDIKAHAEDLEIELPELEIKTVNLEIV